MRSSFGDTAVSPLPGLRQHGRQLQLTAMLRVAPFFPKATFENLKATPYEFIDRLVGVNHFYCLKKPDRKRGAPVNYHKTACSFQSDPQVSFLSRENEGELWAPVCAQERTLK